MYGGAGVTGQMPNFASGASKSADVIVPCSNPTSSLTESFVFGDVDFDRATASVGRSVGRYGV